MEFSNSSGAQNQGEGKEREREQPEKREERRKENRRGGGTFEARGGGVLERVMRIGSSITSRFAKARFDQHGHNSDKLPVLISLFRGE